MLRLVIIADDFTGALDTGVQFTKQGVKTIVSTRLDLELSKIDRDIQVLVVDTESRHVSSEEAYKRVFSIASNAKDAGVTYVFKKTDSTLRGNIGIELKAVMDAWNTTKLMFVPAYPSNGRTTRNGNQYVDGIPLDKSPFSQDPLEPMGCSCISEIIQNQCDYHCENINITGLENFELKITMEKSIYIFDAETQKELRLVCEKIKKVGLLKVTAGCAGFASVLVDEIPFVKHESKYKEKSGSMLAVCGSLNKASFKQITYAKSQGFEVVKMTPEQKLWSFNKQGTELNALIEYLTDLIRQNKNVVLITADDKEDIEHCDKLALAMNIEEHSIFSVISNSISEVILSVVSNDEVKAITVFGGDTAIAAMNKLNCTGVTPLAEIQPGVVLSELQGGSYSTVLVTKAGGFGEKDVLVKIKEYMEN